MLLANMSSATNIFYTKFLNSPSAIKHVSTDLKLVEQSRWDATAAISTTKGSEIISILAKGIGTSKKARNKCFAEFIQKLDDINIFCFEVSSKIHHKIMN